MYKRPLLSPHIFLISISKSSFFEIFSMIFVHFVQVFRSDGTDTSITLQHHLAWSLITTSGLGNALSVCICISHAKDANFFIFSDRLKLVFIPLLRYFYQSSLMLTLQMDVCGCKFGTSRYGMIRLFAHACYTSSIVDW